MREKIEAVLNEIRPMLRADGGDIQLLGFTDEGIVQVHFEGICGTCPGPGMTLLEGVERLMKEQVPEVRQVVAL
jgi:Fe-S cluster biogenesis protein NfuA